MINTDHSYKTRQDFIQHCKRTCKACWFDVLGAAIMGFVLALIIVYNLPGNP